jgi:hypothetical protein
MRPPPTSQPTGDITIKDAITNGVFHTELQKLIDHSTGYWGGKTIRIKSVDPTGHVELEGGGMSAPWKVEFDPSGSFEKLLGDDDIDWYFENALPHPDSIPEFEAALDPNRIYVD